MKPELRSELLRRAEQDQEARRLSGREWAKAAAVDAENLPWLEGVVAEVGWPGRSMVGADGAHAAWLLVQHCDTNPAFQRRCLGLITEAVRNGDATPAELAYLTDRVLLAEGQPQEYGTQMRGHEHGWAPGNLRDPDNVDERRAAMSLGPISEYVARMTRDFGPPKPASLTCADCGAGIEAWLPAEGEAREIRCAACGWTTTVTVGRRAGPPPVKALAEAGTTPPFGKIGSYRGIVLPARTFAGPGTIRGNLARAPRIVTR